MNHPLVKKLLPHLIAIAVFLVVGISYFSPVMDGYRISQSDIKQHKGTSKEIQDHRERYGEEPLWTNNVFGGMPTTQISQFYPNNFMQHVSKAFQLWLPSPLNFFFILMIGFYIMTLFLDIKPWLGILGSVAYALSCYFIIIIMVGHNTKVLALGYLPAMIGAVIYTYRSQKIFLGAAFVTLFVALELTSNHVQITYYGLMVLMCYAIAEFVNFYKRKETKNFFIRSGFVGAAFLIGALPAIGNLWGTMEYGKYTTRGGSEITITPPGSKEEANDKTNGLDRSYITGWSYGVDETWNLLIPNAKGGASDALLNNEVLMKEGPFTEDEKMFMQISAFRDRHYFSEYWGDQSMTAGPTYIGAILIFLCILAFIFVDDNLKWALLAATVLTTMLAWGKNFPGLTNFFIDYFPMYTKFRTVSMMLVIAELTIPLLAILALKKISESKEAFPAQKIKRFMIASGVLLVILLGLAATKGGSIVRSPESETEYFANYKKISEDYMKSVEKSAAENGGMEALDQQTQAIYSYSKRFMESAGPFEEKLTEYRRGVFAADAWRSFFFILMAALIVFGYLKQKLNVTVMMTGISLLVVIDLWMVDKRWVNNEIVTDNGKEVKDQEGNPVYRIWTKAAQNDKPHAADFTDMLIFQNEFRNNPAIKTMALENRAKLLEAKKNLNGKEKTITREEEDFILFGALNLNTNYRVLNTTAALDQDGKTCYFHKSLGGYHGAKLVRIQDVIDFQLGNEQRNVRMALNAGSIPGIDSALKKFPVINMLNTKYIILDPSGGGDNDKDGVPDGYILDIRNPEMRGGMPSALLNPHACGNAWFVNEIKVVKNADEEIVAIGKFDPSTTAIIDEREMEKLGGFKPSADPSATVKMDKYKANHITYTSKSSKKNLLVFSEIYYPAGWKVLVDGTETEIIRVNYLLRAIVLEPGDHKIEMIFEPASYYTAKPISLLGSISVIGLVLFAFYREWKQSKGA